MSLQLYNKVFCLTSGFIKVDIDSIQWKITVSMVTAGQVNTVIITDDFPKLSRRGTKLNSAVYMK